MQYRDGVFVSASSATATTLTLGFVPSKFVLTNYTAYETQSCVTQAIYYNGMAAGYALIQTTDTTLVPIQSLITSNGFTTFSTGASFASTILTITGIASASPGVVTVSSIGSLANGDIVTLSNVVGMVQVNTQRYVVAGISGNTFKLYSFFGNPIDTSGFGTYVSGGQVNIISTPAVAPTISSTTGQVTAQGQPAGLQYDAGSMGIILGTGLFRNNADTFHWEAFLQSPTGY